MALALRAVLAGQLIIAFYLGMSAHAGAQLTRDLLSDPARLIASLSFALQTGDQSSLYRWMTPGLLQQINARTNQTGLDDRLNRIGPILKTEQPEGSNTAFRIRTTHAHAIVVWHVALDASTSRVSKLDFSISPVAPDILVGGGGPNSEVGRLRTEDLVAPRARIHRRPNVAPSPLPLPPIPESRRQSRLRADGELRPLVDPRIVEFLFATVREKRFAEGSVSYTGGRSSDIHYGAASIRVPEDHKIGRIELPRNWTLFGVTLRQDRMDEKKHFVIRSVKSLDESEWDDVVRSKASKKALIFVHGFANTFQDALFRNAQMIWDLQYPGLSIVFSWASSGGLLDYVYDQNSANHARPAFIALLRKLEALGVDQIDVLAHSMGNLVVLEALASHSQTSNPVKIGELLMAAPDVDRDVFVGLIPAVQRITRGLTLYASSADKALAASRIPAGVPRAGDVPFDGPVVLKDLETIDVTAIGEEFLGLNHSEFATNRVVMDDIKLIISTGMRPPSSRLSQIRRFPEPPGVARYWRYAP
jgi:esterase/lipase superfamily enzyme